MAISDCPDRRAIGVVVERSRAPHHLYSAKGNLAIPFLAFHALHPSHDLWQSSDYRHARLTASWDVLRLTPWAEQLRRRLVAKYHNISKRH